MADTFSTRAHCHGLCGNGHAMQKLDVSSVWCLLVVSSCVTRLTSVFVVLFFYLRCASVRAPTSRQVLRWRGGSFTTHRAQPRHLACRRCGHHRFKHCCSPKLPNRMHRAHPFICQIARPPANLRLRPINAAIHCMITATQCTLAMLKLVRNLLHQSC